MTGKRKLTYDNLISEVYAVQQITIIPQMLDVICRITGMGFAAVARVTEDRWITCSVKDDILFGLKPGDELKIDATIYNEVRQKKETVIIEHVDKDEIYCKHPTPAMYGFQSYISERIYHQDGSFFGTLCAIDPKPAHLNSIEIKSLFSLFSNLISLHLQSVEQNEQSASAILQERAAKEKALEQQNEALKKMNAELESFAYVAGHDLQEPLRKIQTFANRLLESDYSVLSENGKQYVDRMNKSVTRMQMLIADLLAYTKLNDSDQIFEHIDLKNIIEEIKQVFNDEIVSNNLIIETGDMCAAHIIKFQFHQLLHNLITNSIKFRKPNITPVIQIKSAIEKGNNNISDKLNPDKDYCHLTVSDNGIGFAPQYNETIFKIFHRLNGQKEYAGTGIGLSIVKKIVDNHKGTITASGKINDGAVFDIYLQQSS